MKDQTDTGEAILTLVQQTGCSAARAQDVLLWNNWNLEYCLDLSTRVLNQELPARPSVENAARCTCEHTEEGIFISCYKDAGHGGKHGGWAGKTGDISWGTDKAL